jgi:hypothetical protein
MASAVSAGDLTLYRTHPQVANSYLWVDKPHIVYQGLVNQAAAFTYPIVDPIPVDNETGTAADVKQDMLITFGTTAGGDDLGRTRVMGITGTTVSVPRISQGTVDGTVKLSDNVHFTIWDTFPPAPRIPFFEETFQEFYKDGIRVFVAALPPLANIGYSNIYADLVNASDKLVLTIDSTDSFSPIGGTLTRLWDVEDGTITSGSASSAAITVEFPIGRRWISLLLSDTTNSRSTIRYLLVVACKVGDATYAPITDAKAGTLTQTVEGLRQSFTFGQDIAASTYIDGAAVCYFQREFYGSTEDALHDSTVVKFAGWHRTDPARLQAQATHEFTEVTLDCIDTAGVLAQQPGFPQTIESEASPIRWEQMASPNLDKFLVYLWLYHSTASNNADFTWSATTTTYPFVRLNALGNSMYGQIDGRARAIGYRLLSNAKGRCKVKKDPMLFDSGSRDSTNVISLTEADIVSIVYTHQRPPRSHWNRGNAIIASSSAVNAVFCIAPGVVPSWGVSASEIGENLVASQTELNARVGHAYQRENAPETYVEVELLHAGDLGLEPLDFIRITLSSTYAAQRGLTWTTQRFMVVAINTDFEPTYGTKRVRLTLEKEIFGTPAETVIPPDNPFPEIITVTDLYPPDDTVAAGDFPLAAIGTDGLLYTTTDFGVPSSAGGPDWTSTNLGLTGDPVAFLSDPFSPGFVSTGAINGWIVTTSRIYRITDIFGTVGVASQFTFRAAITGAGGRSLDASFSVQNWLAVSSYYAVDSAVGDRGVWTTYTTDGSTWATEQQLSSTTSNFFKQAPGLYVSSKTAGRAYTTIMTGASGSGPTSAGRQTSDYGLNWSALSSPNLAGINLAMDIHVPYHDNASETIAYFSLRDQVTAVQKLFRVSGTTQTDITPVVAGKSYTMHQLGKGALATNPTNRQRVVLCSNHNDDLSGSPSHYGVFVSQDAGDSWTLIDGGDGTQKYAHGSITDDNTIYVWGFDGRVGYATDFATIDERGPGGSARIVGITGS